MSAQASGGVPCTNAAAFAAACICFILFFELMIEPLLLNRSTKHGGEVVAFKELDELKAKVDLLQSRVDKVQFTSEVLTDLKFAQSRNHPAIVSGTGGDGSGVFRPAPGGAANVDVAGDGGAGGDDATQLDQLTREDVVQSTPEPPCPPADLVNGFFYPCTSIPGREMTSVPVAAQPAPLASDSNPDCANALCTGHLGADTTDGPDWVQQEQQRLTSSPDAKHKLIVILGSSPDRMALKDHYCPSQKAQLCAPISESVRGPVKQGCNAHHKRSVCHKMCAGTKFCMAHETYYCVTKPVASKEETATIVYVHNGFGVHPHGPWKWHGIKGSQIHVQGNNMRKNPATAHCAATDVSKNMEQQWGAPWLDTPGYHWMPMDEALSPGDAQMRLTGILLRNLPAALGFQQVDGLVISAGLWDLDRVRNVGNGPVSKSDGTLPCWNDKKMGDPGPWVLAKNWKALGCEFRPQSFLDRDPTMAEWLEGYQVNASALIQVAKHVMGFRPSEDASSRIAWMTRAKSPAAVGGKPSTPSDMYYGNRISRINDVMRDVALGQQIGLIDWAKYEPHLNAIVLIASRC